MVKRSIGTMKSLGFIEIPSVTAAIEALDTMCKTADVEFVTWERKLGGRLVTIIIKGDVAAVTEAIDNAVKNAMKPCVHAVIPNPHEETIKMVELSATKFK
jgi:ethanolamine utilization protein EutM